MTWHCGPKRRVLDELECTKTRTWIWLGYFMPDWVLVIERIVGSRTSWVEPLDIGSIEPRL